MNEANEVAALKRVVILLIEELRQPMRITSGYDGSNPEYYAIDRDRRKAALAEAERLLEAEKAQ